MPIEINGTTVINDSRGLENVTGIGHLVPTPSITSPTTGATDVGSGAASITFTSDTYYSLYNVSQGGAELQISTASDFSSITETVTDTGSVTSLSVDITPGSSISTSTTYYSRLRYYDSNSVYSSWSDTVSFTTASVFNSTNTPSITSPATGAIDQAAAVTFNTSAFGLASGSGTHVSSDWQISTVSDFSTIFEESLDDTSNLTSYTNSTSFSTSTTYYVRVRHTDTTYGDSDWSSTVSFTTLASFHGEQAYYCTGTFSWVAPAGVTSVSMVVVGGGGAGGGVGSSQGGGGGLFYANNVPVTSGCTYTVQVGTNGCTSANQDAGYSRFVFPMCSNACIYAGNGGIASGGSRGTSGTPTISGSYGAGNGGQGGYTSSTWGGAGGAGGYGGAGGNGGNNGGGGSPGSCGSGGGSQHYGAGGGTGLFGQGTNGLAGDGSNNQGGGGSHCQCTGWDGGNRGCYPDTPCYGSASTCCFSWGYPGGGGGGGGGWSSVGAPGGVRIVWPGTTRQFPTTCVLPTDQLP